MREIGVWTVDLHGLPADGELLDEDELARWRRLRTAGLRARFAAAHWARRTILGDCVGIDPAALRFTTGRWGKPELADGSIFHSLSHCGAVAMVAVSADAPVGVDIEAVRPDLPAGRLARTFFPAPEARAVEAAADPPARYIRLWTRKEAAGKVVGLNLDRTLRIGVVDTATGPVPLERLDGGPAVGRITDIAAPGALLAAVARLGPEPFTVRMSSLAPVPA
ncbi:MAG: 4'-phosphopantetheinyl transferase superfamily protein [Nakamurella multipartita]